MYEADKYGSHIREEMKRSMEKPAKAKAKSIRHERRGSNTDRLLFEVRRWWWHMNDDIKLVVWAMSMFGLGVVFWMTWMVYPR